MRLLILAVFALFYMAHCEEGARLLASKSLLLNRYAEDWTLQCLVCTAGSRMPDPGRGVVGQEERLDPPWMALDVFSDLRVGDMSHAAVLQPLEAAHFNFTSATIAYLAQEGGQVVVGFTSAAGQRGILAQREFDRRFSPRFLDWAAFGVMTLPSIGMLLLWDLSRTKYDSPKTKKK